ncbi:MULTISPECIES: metalloregulator ArsR/SmtB family transcription factor [unclassified Paenibacillus]|uniref:helix-turn-helix transcriptional regulator n=1 Tax=unclassified Paenibacillus TaxID=185978 RepID=UPI001C119939|nr:MULTISPECIES: metalloregulator ArsR/SmtB family transcription factor [unclassified Paenibacillus]MBU5445523.1 transcriptional regulator [Paenibacillus sp. MSJ-34]
MTLDKKELSTRKNILLILKTKGPLSTKEITKHLGITEMAVRRHLGSLERDELIEASMIRQAMGRPTYIYSLTETADDIFPKKYHHLTLDLLEELADEAGDDMIDLLFERRKKRLQQKYEANMEGKPLTERITALADMQNENGYMVEWETGEDGQYVFKEHNCPISQIANQYNQACNCELKLFESLLKADVKRTECLAKGDNKCVYIIKEQAKQAK